MVLRQITRLIGRRPSHRRERSQRPVASTGAHLVIWESELRAIAAEATAWSIETGGDLFGLWRDNPTVLIATKAGPNAERNNAHFRLDVEYLRQLSETLASDWGLRYFGDWHSHHRLGLTAPSSGDKRRIYNLGERNQFAAMAEIIVTLEDTRHDPIIRINPWLYELADKGRDGPSHLPVRVLTGLSPVRQALIASRVLPEQQLSVWQTVPLDRIRISGDDAAPALETAPAVDATMREKALSQLTGALTSLSGHPVEQHQTAFGCIIVATLKEPHYLAFAFGADWPMGLLDVHRINRDTGTTTSIEFTDTLSAPDVPGILQAYTTAKAAMTSGTDVDQ